MSSEKPQFTSADVTDPLAKWILSDDASATKEETLRSKVFLDGNWAATDPSKSQRERIRSVAEETTSSIDEHIPEWVVNNATTILAIVYRYAPKPVPARTIKDCGADILKAVWKDNYEEVLKLSEELKALLKAGK